MNFGHQINALGFRNTNDASVTMAVGSMVMSRENNKVEIFKLAETTTVSNE